jgi:methylated-DNA-[protein]-cysteine S-methyltransferase
MTKDHDELVGAAVARLSIDTPVGRLLLAGDDATLTYLCLPGSTKLGSTKGDVPAALRTAAAQLAEYFAGSRTAFALPLAPQGTAFQLTVWKALADIPYGETVTYGELAERVGHPSASRAVGQANGANPLPIVYPCHRVVASGGHLGGYGGGLALKRRLLALEGSPLAGA